MKFTLLFGNELRAVTKIDKEDFTPLHRESIEQVQYRERRLVLPHPDWHSQYLGAGEEKAVYCVCDHLNHVFALEVIDERHYLDGRFEGGEYFCETRASGLTNVKANPDSIVGLTFTGKVKAREYVYGYEWARFQYDPKRKSSTDVLLTGWLRLFLSGDLREFRARYADVHDRNVMFEIRHPRDKGVPVIAKDWAGRTGQYRIGLQAIDVR